MPLELNTALVKLPSLATECVLIGHAKKADVIWTKAQFFALCRHMLNDNDPNYFLIPYRKDEGGAAYFAKAKTARADRRTNWAWDTITGHAKIPASIGFYPRTPDGKSRWAAMDFDAHDGEAACARDWALDAFRVLFRHPELFLVLCTSGGGGWHLFVLSREFYAVEDWNRLLKQAAEFIGATVGAGLCEIFPSETRGTTGYGIRAPGVWNPKSGEFGLIAFQNVAQLLLQEEKESSTFLYRSTHGAKGSEFTYRQKEGVYRGLKSEWKDRFAITAKSTRHEKLMQLVDHIFRQAGRETASADAQLQYREATAGMKATLKDHMDEFAQRWDWWLETWHAELSELEQRRLAVLTTENERDAYRIIHSFSRAPRNENAKDFPIVCQNLADRLGITLPGAVKIREKLWRLGFIERTALYVPNRFAARYRWLAADMTLIVEEMNASKNSAKQTADNSSSVRSFS